MQFEATDFIKKAQLLWKVHLPLLRVGIQQTRIDAGSIKRLQPADGTVRAVVWKRRRGVRQLDGEPIDDDAMQQELKELASEANPLWSAGHKKLAKNLHAKDVKKRAELEVLAGENYFPGGHGALSEEVATAVQKARRDQIRASILQRGRLMLKKKKPVAQAHL